MSKRQTRPTEEQMKWLRRISHFPMQVTYEPGKAPHYSLADDIQVPFATASLMIRKGWVIAEKDSIFDRPKSYRVKMTSDP